MDFVEDEEAKGKAGVLEHLDLLDCFAHPALYFVILCGETVFATYATHF